jgi:hypothetical protein
MKQKILDLQNFKNTQKDKYKNFGGGMFLGGGG